MQPTLLTRVVTRDDTRALRFAERAGAVAFMIVLTAAAAQISIPLPFTPVPLTLQPMVVLIGGAVLGSRLGMMSQLIYLALGVAGMPVFAASPALPQGAARLLGPTGGYLLTYPIAAFVTGWLAERGFDRRYPSSFVAMLAGLAVIFAGGVGWLAVFVQPSRGFAGALAAGLTPFIVPDLLKLALAAGAMPALWRVTGRPNTNTY
jgi:biotin transport system substrate-specific component